MFCLEVIQADIEHLMSIPTRNSVLGPLSEGEGIEFDRTGEHGRIEEVFGMF